MTSHAFTRVPKAVSGDRVAILSPAFAAPAVSEAVHERAMRRLTEATGLVPVEYPTTRLLGASAEARAGDVTAAFADPTIRAVLATIGGDDQVTVIPHIDIEVLAANPKPFLGYSDNTNLHNLLWSLGVPSFYGGSTQVHLGPGPHLDDVHLLSLRAALLDGGWVELTEPGQSEDFGIPWTDPRALTDFGVREPTEPWTWAGPRAAVEGRTWGGCIEVIDQLALADRMPHSDDLAGGILLLETSEETALGRRGQTLGTRPGRARAPRCCRRRGRCPAACERPRLPRAGGRGARAAAGRPARDRYRTGQSL